MKKILILCVVLAFFTADAAFSTPLPGLSADTDSTIALNDAQNFKFTRNWETPPIPRDIYFNRDGNDGSKIKRIAFIAPWRPSWLPKPTKRYWSKRFREEFRGHKFFRKRGGGDSPNPVPEPATMLLFGTGLVGLTIISRKKRKNK